jgi:hypothetical protein
MVFVRKIRNIGTYHPNAILNLDIQNTVCAAVDLANQVKDNNVVVFLTNGDADCAKGQEDKCLNTLTIYDKDGKIVKTTQYTKADLKNGN